MTLCLRRIAPQSFLRVSRGLFILPGDLELPEPPTLLLYGDKNVLEWWDRTTSPRMMASSEAGMVVSYTLCEPEKVKHQVADVPA